MKVAELLGTRLASGDDHLPVYEGPLAGTRTSLDLAAAARAIHRVEDELATQESGRLRVGILSNHQIETYVSVMACVTGNHTFVPLNPKFPLTRLDQILDLGEVDVIAHDSGTVSVLTDLSGEVPSIDVSALIGASERRKEADVVAQWRHAVGERTLEADDIAYVMFTSGSTGTPKGVPVSYSNLTHYVQGLTAEVAMEQGLRYTQFFDLSFDLSIHDIFVSNYLWGTLVAPSMIDLLMPAAYVVREHIDAWFSVPLLGGQLGRSERKPGYAGLRHVLFCGEALPMETVIACRDWLADGGDIWNLYGPTEATIAFTGACVTDSPRTAGNASIGRPFGDNEVAIAIGDDVHEATEDGLEGELLLGGPQVFGGYSTDAKSPFLEADGACWYRSGDLVRIDDEGVYFRGRLDSQVKFRGYRIELGEIEAAIRQTFGLTTVAVVLTGEQAEASLVLYHLSAETQGDLDMAELSELLPNYMLPGHVIALQAMPTNPNGKIDRKVLSGWGLEPPESVR